MAYKTLSMEEVVAFRRHLEAQERSAGTVENYLRHVSAFARWLDGRPVTKENAAGWKGYLTGGKYRPATVNAMLASLNQFFLFTGRQDCRVKPLLLETICATGIRVSEVAYITVEAARQGQAEIFLKGKVRLILLPQKLCRKLLRYAKKQKTASGEVFLTKNGNSLSRKQIWAEMKALCRRAGVAPSKVYPHNLRHLFARAFYRITRDVAKLADVLGHSSIETTRLYLISTGAEHARQMERMQLIR